VRWILVAAAALVAVVAVNVALLSYGGNRHDPVGRLSPIASLPGPAPAPAISPRAAHREGDD
jgi:hypothetical protein